MPQIILIFVFSFLFIVPAFCQKYEELGNVAYTDSSDPYALERCKLDLYYSPDLQERLVVVWFHGGDLTGAARATERWNYSDDMKKTPICRECFQ